MNAAAQPAKQTILLVHGWGFHSGLWQDVTPLLKDFEIKYVDLGFIWQGPKGTSRLPQNAICVGHSFGLAWLLRHGPRPMRGLVSIAGFDNYSDHMRRDHLASMKLGLDKDAEAELMAFWRAIGIGDFSDRVNFDVAGMRGALDWIANWDLRQTRNNLTCPIMALASADDPFVPKAMSEAIWGKGDLRMRDDGSHALPLTQPTWCADAIREFAAGISD